MNNERLEEKLNTEFHIKNTEIALKFWNYVPKDKVSGGLNAWLDERKSKKSCGTIACFGGWCPLIPEFAVLGLKHEIGTNAPTLRELGITVPSKVAKYLFGELTMFYTYGACIYDNYIIRNLFPANEPPDDHELVHDRLQENLKRLHLSYFIKNNEYR